MASSGSLKSDDSKGKERDLNNIYYNLHYKKKWLKHTNSLKISISSAMPSKKKKKKNIDRVT